MVESNSVKYPGSSFSNKYAWSGKGHGLDNKGIITIIVPSSYPVYLSYSTHYEIFSPDIGLVELSSDNGYNWYPMDSITGVQSDWTIRSVDISSFAGLSVLIRFRYTTGSFSTSDGWYVDSIMVKNEVVEDFEGYDGNDYWGDWIIIDETGNLSPTVNINYPVEGETVSGTAIISGEAHDPDGDTTIEWVMINIDNSGWEYTDGTVSWSYVWDTTTVNDGSHIISALSSDGILQSSVDTISVIVDNGVGPVDKPDLVITDVWIENDLIYYQIRNIGNTSANGGHYTTLFVNNKHKVNDQVEIVLASDERFNSYFNFDWDCTQIEVSVSVIADYEEVIVESKETNNQREELWKCDNIPPRIISGPVAQSISQRSVTIFWKTDEDCDSAVHYDRFAGKYNNIEYDTELVNVHDVKLTGLIPGTSYHFVVESMDITGNMVKSRDFIFTTLSVSDNVKPSLSPFIPEVLSGVVNISVDALDDVGVDYVHFSCDNEPIYTDYSAPYEFGFNTGGLLDGDHDFGFIAGDGAGNVVSDTLRGEVLNKFPPELSPINVEIISPREDGEYILGDKIHIYAKVETKIEIPLRDYSVAAGGYTRYHGDFVFFPWMDDIIIPGINVPNIGERTYWVNYWWDTIDFIPDDKTLIIVNAWNEMNNTGRDSVEIVINVPPPEVQVFRDVERDGNCYKVELKIRNNGIVPIKDIQIYDTSVGFQCADWIELDPPRILSPGEKSIIGGIEPFNEGRNHFDAGDYSQLQIDLPYHYEVDQDGGEMYLWYYVVPVLYDCNPFNSVSIEGLEWDSGTIAVPHVIGHDLSIEYEYIGEQYLLQKDDLRWDLSHNDDTCCPGDVSCAFRDSDYLIVTSPTKLDRENPENPDDVNELLSTIAELARLKNGVLGYTWTDSWEKLHSYIKENGEWWEYLCPRIGGHGRALFDYLLLVGETEIIPSRTKGGFDLEWCGGDKVDPVDLTDKSYSNIKGDNRPDIAVGRIIGNSASDLITPIKTSINIHNNIGGYEFDRSDALLVSGTGNSNDTAQQDINAINDLLNFISEFFDMYENVDTLHWTRYPGNEADVFRANTSNRDVVLYIGHGNIDWWSPGVDTTRASRLGFGSAKPFVYAYSCLTGDYESDDDYNIAEAFFKSLVGVYIGSTEVAPISKGDSFSYYFFEHWDPHESIGKTFKDLKRHYYNSGEWWRYVCYEFNLYGDPKFGVIPDVGLVDYLDDGSISRENNGEDPISYIEVMIPDYMVSTFMGDDYVDIPGGEILSREEGRPRVPYYIKSIEYPKGYRVQNVILTERSGLMTDMGLELPVVILDPNIGFVEMKGDWYPHDDYSWRVEENDDGSTTLIITMYPFYYNPDTTMVKFYKNYKFDINYVYSDITITELFTDKYMYKPGDIVNIDMWFENIGETQDFIVKMLIKNEVNEEITDGLLLRSFEGFQGIGSYSPIWEIDIETITDSFFIEATIMDNNGNIIDVESDIFCIDKPSIEIESINEGLGATATIKNTGTQNITNLTWLFSIEGNLVTLSGKSIKEGTVPLLKADDSVSIKSGFVFGFGPAEITINAAGVTKKANCFILGPFVIKIKET
jgi:hypothetical protein